MPRPLRVSCRAFLVAMMALLSAIGAATYSAPVIAAGKESAKPSPGWPEFRGPSSDGHAPAGCTLPLEWSETQHVKWKTPIPLQGWSTPVILDGQIWLTTGTPDGHELYAICVDAESGAVKFNNKLFDVESPEPLGNAVNCYASPTSVIEPGRVYVNFGTYGTACLDTATGKPLWERRDLPCRHFRGPGSSVVLFDDLIILTFDGVDQQYMAALDKKTGKTVWRTDRTTKWADLDENGKPKREGDFRKAYSTPLVVTADGKSQLVTVGSSAAFSYDPKTGAELWTLRMPGYTPATRPVFGNGLAYLTTGRGKQELLAVRVSGHGDITDTNVAWKAEGSVVPQEPSPLLVDGLLYVVTNNGLATCLDAATGAQVWSERIGGNYLASPIVAGDRIYFFSTQGKATILKAGRTYEVLGANTLDASFMASPAVLGNALILRSKTDLYRIE